MAAKGVWRCAAAALVSLVLSMGSALLQLGLAGDAAQRRRESLQTGQPDVGTALLAGTVAAVLHALQRSAHRHQLIVVAARFGIAHGVLGRLVGLGGIGILWGAVGRFHALAVRNLHH